MKKLWWHNKIAYQIYPKSFYDSNGDGIGDIKGIIRKMDYLKALGIDLLWLSPVYASPMADQGYDISDYYQIDSVFGNMEDMDQLLREAKKRGMYVIMDLVVNHCSDEHEWFKKACLDPDGPYGKFFYIETVKNGKLPCNWRSYFGGPVWDKLPGHEDKYYLHLFHKKQPDLNWENPMVREEIYKMMNWWLDRGLDGFRIDAIINIKKALPFKSYPADREDGLCSIQKMLNDAVGIGTFLCEMRDRTFVPHQAFTVGEVVDERQRELTDFFGENGYFSSVFDFSANLFGMYGTGWHERLDITPDDYRDCVFSAQKKAESIGFLSNIIENHDEPRGVSHYIPEGDINDRSKKMLATVYFLLRGIPWIYQGQEIGMENLEVTSIDEVDDIWSVDSYQVARKSGFSEKKALQMISKYGRDNARTPFQWDDSKQAGFTTGIPWLNVNPNYRRINFAAQENDPESVWNYYRSLIALRKEPEYEDTWVYGTFIPYLEDQHNVMAYIRSSSRKRILVIANYQNEPQTLQLPAPCKSVLLSNLSSVVIEGTMIRLEEYQAAVVELA